MCACVHVNVSVFVSEREDLLVRSFEIAALALVCVSHSFLGVLVVWECYSCADGAGFFSSTWMDVSLSQGEQQ